jgi:Spy/CpxP family protein refolding chaperone
MKKLFGIAISTLLVMSLALPVLAFEGDSEEHGDGWMAEDQAEGRMLSALNLTEEQKEQLAKLRKNHMLERFDYRQAMRKFRVQQRTLRAADNPNRAEAFKLIDKMSLVQADWMKTGVDHLMDMRSVLSPEQIAKMQAIRKDKRGSFRKGRSMKSQHGRHGMKSRMGDRTHGMGERMKKTGMRRMMAFEKLNLTEEQQDAIAALQKEHLSQGIDNKQAMRKLRKEGSELRRAQNPDKAKAYALVDQTVKLKADWQKRTFDHHMKMRAVLTDEQKLKLKEMKEHMKDKRGHGFKKDKRGHGQGYYSRF